MGFVNKIILMGNTTRDPELRQLPSGTTVCDFGMATNRVYKTAAGEEKQETVFVDCTAFGRTAEVIAEYCPKGRSLFVEGRLHYETWEDKTGNRRSKLSVIVENFQFVGGREQQHGETGRQRELPINGSRKAVEGDTVKAVPARRGHEKPGNGRASEGPARSAVPVMVAKKNGKARVANGTRTEDKAVDQLAEEQQQLEDADLPF